MDPHTKPSRRYQRLAVAIILSGLTLLVGGGLLSAQRGSVAAPATLAQATGDIRLDRLAKLGDNPNVGAVAVVGDQLFAGFGAKLVVTTPADGAAPKVRGSMEFSDDIMAIAAAPPYVYVLTRSQFLAVDVTDPARPRVLGDVSALATDGGDIELDSRYAYLGVADGLQVVDVGDPTHPQTLVTAGNLGLVSSVDVVGHFAYLITPGDQALVVMDLQNPAAPVEVGRLSDGTLHDQLGIPAPSGHSFAVAVEDHYAYITVGNDVTVADVTEASAPKWVGWQELPGGGDVTRLHVTNHIAYVTTGLGLLQLDLAIPTKPVVRAWWPNDGELTGGLDVSGTAVYLATSNGLRVVADSAPPAGLRPAGSVRYSLNGGRLVAASDRVLYVGDDATTTLSAYDTSDADAPRLLGTLGHQPYAAAMVAEGGMAYRAVYTGTLDVIDATDPARLHVVAAMTNTYLSDLVVQGGLVYTVGPGVFGADRFQIMDARTPTALHMIGHLDDVGDDAQWVEVAGGWAYVLTTTGQLTVIDVSDPARPRVVGRLGVIGGPPLALDGPPLGLAVAGKAAVIFEPGYLTVVDVADPGAPRAVSTYWLPREIGEVSGLAAFGQRVVVTCNDWALAIIDVSNPTVPRFVNAVSLNEAVMSVVVAGNLAYVDGSGRRTSDGLVGLVDLSGPDGFRDAPGLVLPGGGQDVRLQGQHAFVTAGPQGLQVVDVADPAHPALVASIDLGNPSGRLAVKGNTAFVITSSPPRFWLQNAFAQLASVDVADPAQPRLISTVQLGTVTVRDLEVRNGLAFLLLTALRSAPSLQVWDVTKAASPRLLGTVTLVGVPDASGLALAGNTAFIAGDSAGLVAVNIADPAQLAVVGTLSLNGRAVGVTAGEGYGYVAVNNNSEHDGSLAVVNLYDPQRLRVVSRFALTANLSATGLDLTGHQLFVTDPDAGVFVVDVTDPTALRLAAEYRPPNPQAGSGPPPIRAVAAAGDHAYLATDDSVLWSLAVTSTAPPSIYLPLAGRGWWIIDVP